MSASHDTGGARIAMLHAWLWFDSPAGMFVSDCWVLPFVRGGLPAPSSAPSAAAGRAMSLLTGGDVFYTALAQAMGEPGPADSAVIRDTVARYRREVADFVRPRQGT